MTGGKLIGEITRNSEFTRMKEMPNSLKLLDKTVQLSTNMASSIAKGLVKQVIKRSLDTGIGF